jgi:putative endonuclease
VHPEFGPCVYIMASRRNGALYTGVTSDLPGRIYQHREGILPGFTRKHGVKRLVWFEQHATMEQRSCARSGSRSGFACGSSS